MTRSDTQAAPATPLAERALAPDLARGLLLLSIALANSALYLHGREYGIRLHPAVGSAADHLVGALLATFVDGRAYPLFAALFAYGMVQVHRRQPDARRLLRRRSGWLIAFGGVHAVLLFSGDILGTYGLLGLALVGLVSARERTLLVLAGLWLVPTAVVTGFVYGAVPVNGAQRSYLWSLAIADPLQAAAWRPVEWLMTVPAMIGVGSAALVGVWAARRRILDEPAAHLPLLRRVAIGGIAVAVAGGLPTGLVLGAGWAPAPATMVSISGLHAVTGIAGGLGYAALVGLAAARLGDRAGPVTRALVATGQRSLTMYLLQSVVFVGLLAAYAGGLGARLGTAEVAVVAVLTWLGTVLLAEHLRRRGARGPAEVLLRRLTYRRH